MRVLVIEDEAKVGAALQRGLEAEGYEVVLALRGDEGFGRLHGEPFDLLILDLMLPDRDGFEILATLRGRGIALPVLILTARDTVEDRVRGLDGGADDYLVKPFAFPELLARLRLLLRRGRGERAARLRLADLELDAAARSVTRGRRSLELTAKEFDLLEYLLRHQGHIVSREMIARDLWQAKARSTPLDNVIDVHVAHLRRKVDGPFEEKLLRTVRGVGFILQEGRP